MRLNWSNWNRLGDVGLSLMENPVALVGTSFLACALPIGYFAKVLHEPVGHWWYLLAWLIATLLGTVFMSWLTGPLWGIRYLSKIEADFGPKTRAAVWKWFDPATVRDGMPLSIVGLAMDCGEVPQARPMPVAAQDERKGTSHS